MADTTCAVAGCERPIKSRGWCKRHYERWRTTGSVYLRPKQPDPGCSVDGCSEPHRSRGWCNAHYFRFYRKGSTDLTYPLGHESVTSHGYWRVKAPDHPLADSHGRVYVHRQVLYDAIGTGDHPCHWCGATVRWDWTDHIDMLNVDHLDEDKGNNDRGNLVPSCGNCNRARSRHPDWFAANIACNSGCGARP